MNTPIAVRVDPVTGFGTGEGDLWCTYAAIRTLSWLGRSDTVAHREATVNFLLGKRNTDGGYAWNRGMTSDAWATFYCTQALLDLDHPIPDTDRTAEWLARTWSGDAYAMTPGQAPDVWATHFSTRTAVEICGVEIPDRDRLIDWLRRLQTSSGGVAWTPEHAERGDADIRACHYATTTWHIVNGPDGDDFPWRTDALISWIRDRQAPDGGFRFAESSTEPCLWATYRATAALAWLGVKPEGPVSDWIAGQRGDTGGYLRWRGYGIEDVWASFCAVGAARAIGTPIPTATANSITSLIDTMAVASGGYTYRDVDSAADVLSSAAAVLARPHDARATRARAWIRRCVLPNEGGVMYMPARGAEVRSTLWALTTGAFDDDPALRAGIGAWLASIQNPDGGFGYWEGRGSDLVSTAAAAQVAILLDEPIGSIIDIEAASEFVSACRTADGNYATVPRGPAGLRAGLQAARTLWAFGEVGAADPARLLSAHRVRGGGWANEGNRVPDLLSTYEAVATADRFAIPVDVEHLHRFVDRITSPTGIRWSPLSTGSGGSLAECLAALLRDRLSDRGVSLPVLSLS